MPSVSKSQQRLFGMVRAYQKGELKHPSSKIREVAEHISPTAAHDFAVTKEKGLPEHVKKACEHAFLERASQYGFAEQECRVLYKKANDQLGSGSSAMYSQDGGHTFNYPSTKIDSKFNTPVANQMLGSLFSADKPQSSPIVPMAPKPTGVPQMVAQQPMVQYPPSKPMVTFNPNSK